MKIFTRLLSFLGLCLLLLPMQPLEAQRAKQGSAQRTELKTEIDQAQRLSQPKKLATLSAQLVELSIQEQSYPDLLIGLHHLRSAHRDLYGDLDRRPIFEQLDRARRQTWLRAEERSLLLAYIYRAIPLLMLSKLIGEGLNELHLLTFGGEDRGYRGGLVDRYAARL